MKAYKIELLVLDFDQLGRDEIKSVLENGSYPNDCISPSAMHITEVDIGPWSDDSPLNSGKTRAAEYARIFPAEALPAAANGWLPIETAPKDGTKILILTDDGIIESFWRGSVWEQSIVYADYGAHTEIDSAQTHWQPLPSVPQ